MERIRCRKPAEIVAEEYHVSREDQDAFALRSQQRAAEAIRGGRLAEEILRRADSAEKGRSGLVREDEHPRPDTTLEALAKLNGVVKPGGTITAGNASGINDGVLRVVAGFGSGGEETWIDSAGARGGERGCRRCAAGHGHGTCAGDAEGFGEERTVDRADGCD